MAADVSAIACSVNSLCYGRGDHISGGEFDAFTIIFVCLDVFLWGNLGFEGRGKFSPEDSWN